MSGKYCNSVTCSNGMCTKHIANYEEDSIDWTDVEDFTYNCDDFFTEEEDDYEDLDFDADNDRY